MKVQLTALAVTECGRRCGCPYEHPCLLHCVDEMLIQECTECEASWIFQDGSTLSRKTVDIPEHPPKGWQYEPLVGLVAIAGGTR